MYVGNRATVSNNYWDSREAGKEVTITNPNFGSGRYVEVMTDDGRSVLIERPALTVKKNPLDL